MNALDDLRRLSVVVADTGDPEAIRRFAPQDCTTNPTLVLARLRDPASVDMIDRELHSGARRGLSAKAIAARLTVAVGAELAGLVPGRVSTEVDACLSFDVDATVAQAREILADYADRGISRERILIKIAATWEGIRAAERLEAEGVQCNLTLIFCEAQAVAAAMAGAYLISPFVGRITDWYKVNGALTQTDPESDPGVRSVRTIQDRLKSAGAQTIVMAASFRTIDQIRALAGCDRLTIAPALLAELARDERPVDRAISASAADHLARLSIIEAEFRWQMTLDAMATEKLAEGIRGFDRDHRELIQMVADRMG
jgi:transaldolase